MMEIDTLLQQGREYAVAHPAGAVSAAVILIFLLIRRPKFFFLMTLLGVAAIGVMMLFDKISATMGTGKMPFMK